MASLSSECVDAAIAQGLSVKQWEDEDGTFNVELEGRYLGHPHEVDEKIAGVLDTREYEVALTGTDPQNHKRFNILARKGDERGRRDSTPA